MKDVQLVKLSVVLSIFGLIILYALSSLVHLPEIEISTIANEGPVSLSGTIKKINPGTKMTKFTLAKQCEIEVTYFGKLDIDNDEKVRIYGSLHQYNNKTEIIADKITHLTLP